MNPSKKIDKLREEIDEVDQKLMNLLLKRFSITKKIGQVNIMVRYVKGVDDNPFEFETVKKNILEALKGYENRIQVSLVPNITNICYGRGVGYKIEEIVLDEKIQQISATKIREQMRKDGEL